MSVDCQKMQCDICGINDLHCVLKLDPKKFTSKGIKNNKHYARKVCFYCGLRLGQHEYYKFGGFWFNILCNLDVRLIK